MKALLERWRRHRLRRAHARLPERLWPSVIAGLPLLDGLGDAQLARLKDLSALFLAGKRLELARGADPSQAQVLSLALQACLPVLELGLDWYRGWHALILYPDEFVPKREVVDEDGLVWIDDRPKSGEAWEQGPVILSLMDMRAGRERDGFNVVIHEMAHKLDMRDGGANGHPPLHRGMRDRAWADDLGQAYDDLCRRCERGETTPIDDYGTESPAEFFAVCSEAFFELPGLLDAEYPRVYAQLRAFYRQDPLRRLNGR